MDSIETMMSLGSLKLSRLQSKTMLINLHRYNSQLWIRGWPAKHGNVRTAAPKAVQRSIALVAIASHWPRIPGINLESFLRKFIIEKSWWNPVIIKFTLDKVVTFDKNAFPLKHGHDVTNGRLKDGYLKIINRTCKCSSSDIVELNTLETKVHAGFIGKLPHALLESDNFWKCIVFLLIGLVWVIQGTSNHIQNMNFLDTILVLYICVTVDGKIWTASFVETVALTKIGLKTFCIIETLHLDINRLSIRSERKDRFGIVLLVHKKTRLFKIIVVPFVNRPRRKFLAAIVTFPHLNRIVIGSLFIHLLRLSVLKMTVRFCMSNFVCKGPQVGSATQESFRLLQHDGRGFSRCAFSMSLSQYVTQLVINKIHALLRKLFFTSECRRGAKPIVLVEVCDTRPNLSSIAIFFWVGHG